METTLKSIKRNSTKWLFFIALIIFIFLIAAYYIDSYIVNKNYDAELPAINYELIELNSIKASLIAQIVELKNKIGKDVHLTDSIRIEINKILNRIELKQAALEDLRANLSANRKLLLSKEQTILSGMLHDMQTAISLENDNSDTSGNGDYPKLYAEKQSLKKQSDLADKKIRERDSNIHVKIEFVRTLNSKKHPVRIPRGVAIIEIDINATGNVCNKLVKLDAIPPIGSLSLNAQSSDKLISLSKKIPSDTIKKSGLSTLHYILPSKMKKGGKWKIVITDINDKFLAEKEFDVGPERSEEIKSSEVNNED